jgi:hypothetical protein
LPMSVFSFVINNSVLLYLRKKVAMSRHPRNTETYNGVVLGALLVLISLLWFTIPLVFFGRVIIYPGILFLIGVITVIRYSNK